MFDAEDIQDNLEAVGVLAEIPGGGEFYVKPPFFPKSQHAFTGESVESVNPYCIGAPEDVERLNITPGEYGTFITILERGYRVLSIEPENSGYVAIELGSV